MDTKLRNYSHSKWLKVIAFVLVVVCFTSMVLISLKPLKLISESKGDLFDSPFQNSYFLSVDYGWEVTNAIRDITKLAVDYKSEEYIKSGKTIDKEDLRREKEKIFEEFKASKNYNQSLRYEENYKIFEEKYIDDYKEEMESAKDKLIKEDLRDFSRISTKLKQTKDFVYYVKQGDIIFTNTEENSLDDFKKYPAYFVTEGNQYIFYPKEFEQSRNHKWVSGDIGEGLSKVDIIHLGFTDEYINEKLNVWNKSKNIIEDAMYKLLIIFAVLILSLIYLIIVTGKKGFKDSEVVMERIDKLYTDINIIFTVSIIPIWALIVAGFTQHYGLNLGVNIGIGIDSAIACALVLMLLLSLIRHMKNKSLFSYALVFVLGKRIYKIVKDIYESGNVAVKVAVFVVVYPAIVALTVFIFPITVTFAVWLTHKKVKEYIAIKEGVKKIKDGEIDHKINIIHDGELKKLAEDINSIGEGFNSAISNELKSEKLKTELITNVSHDIRTPLTSIITYVDLIKREKDKTKIDEYIEIIEQKSLRLKTLTDDLFEASKASSGNIPVNFEKIDIVSLITQGLGELDTQVKNSQLDFKMSNQSDKVYVNADGRLLWRSIENLLTNIFKYALKGSRVYIDIIDLGDKISLSIKNISAYELNITPDELMERFARGDESRSSEGSGLGLSISKSLIEAQGGEFSIEIDGDLFKVVIVLSKFENKL